jgi:hypothetical protein
METMDEVFKTMKIALEDAEKHLNDAHRRFHEKSTRNREIIEMKLLCAIFQFDICREMVSVFGRQPSGFAASAALKGIVHKLYEYDLLVRNSLRQRMLNFANSYNVPVDYEALSKLEVESKPAIKKLRNWTKIRNTAAGHYDANVKLQVTHIESLTQEQVFDVAGEFLRYNMSLLIILRDAENHSMHIPSIR